ncbi:electron transfer flavoprotein subunit alpha/FixB family protein [Vibrio europaeus]|uniref:electron transfer flavoprotein subunit alpha/FixB family protein n=1 Tax=Vibrio europaeus TaxID=300876 RepID=UPI00148E1275|nr:FAD-binding protein [Vibrio europaeus]NOH23767.1 electron transfer flavoprotein subunit alpha/FixB family protein [Vibrio europaeus]
MSEIKVLVLAQHDNQTPSADFLASLSAAKSIIDAVGGGSVDALVVGCHCDNVAQLIQSCSLLERVLVADNACYQDMLAENLAEVVKQVGVEYSHVLAPANTFGKDVLPRVAALLDVEMLSDVMAIESGDTVVRTIYAGNALARVCSEDVIKVMTIRSTAFDKMPLDDGGSAQLITLDTHIVSQGTQLVSRESAQCDRPELSSANVVISGGRGLGSKENFALVEKLADKLGGAIGASRAAVDAGFVTNDLQVGQTGKIVAPNLYIAVGISGAIQHLAGMKDSKVIVAINSDPDAAIFEIADYGLVGDLFEILPELIESV